MPTADPKKRLLGAASSAAGPAAAVPSANPGLPAGQASAPAPAGSGNFVNYGQLYALNARGAGAMAQRLQEDVRAKAGAAKDALAQGAAAYGGNLAAAAGGTGATFTGAKTWADAGVDTAGLAQKATQASDAARALTSEGGRAASLKGLYASPYAAAGASAFDAMLAGTAGAADYAALARDYGGLNDAVAGAQKGGAATYDAAKATFDAGAQARAQAQDARDAAASTEAAQATMASAGANAKTQSLREQVYARANSGEPLGGAAGQTAIQGSAAVGAAIGSYFGPAGTIAGGAIGGAVGTAGVRVATNGRDAELERMRNELATAQAQAGSLYYQQNPEVLAQRQAAQARRAAAKP